MAPFRVFCGSSSLDIRQYAGSVYVLCIFLILHDILAKDVYFFTTSFFMSKYTKVTALALTFHCSCMSQAAYCCISRIGQPRNTERGAMRVFQIHFAKTRSVLVFDMITILQDRSAPSLLLLPLPLACSNLMRLP